MQESLAGEVLPLTPHPTHPNSTNWAQGQTQESLHQLTLDWPSEKRLLKRLCALSSAGGLTTEGFPAPWALNHLWNETVAFLNYVLLMGFLWTREQGLHLLLLHPASQGQAQTLTGCLVKPRMDGQTQTDGWKGGLALQILPWPVLDFSFLFFIAELLLCREMYG